MKELRIFRAKPNPAGKDRHGSYTPPRQLAAEWIDIQNIGDEPYTLTGISLQHIAYQPGCREPKWDFLKALSGTLYSGQVLRMHSGGFLSTADMNPEDVTGADKHEFTGRGYAWNNDCGDRAGLWNGTIWIDRANYDSYPPEGLILVREGDKLVPKY